MEPSLANRNWICVSGGSCCLLGWRYRDCWRIRIVDVFHHFPTAIRLPGINGDVLALFAKDFLGIQVAHCHSVRSTVVANLARLCYFNSIGAELDGEIWIRRQCSDCSS